MAAPITGLSAMKELLEPSQGFLDHSKVLEKSNKLTMHVMNEVVSYADTAAFAQTVTS